MHHALTFSAALRRVAFRFGLGLIALSPGIASASEVAWAKSYSEATAAAKTSGKLVMIDVYTDWCSWCKKLDTDTYPAPEVAKQLSSFVTLKLNPEKDPDGARLAKKFGVNGYPTLLFIDPEENLFFKVVGYQAAPDFAASLARAATIREDMARYSTALASNPRDFEALAGMATLLSSADKADEAATAANNAATSAAPADRGKLLDVYNAVGDAYQGDGKAQEAIAFFSKSIDPKFPNQAAYARLSIAVTFAQSENPKAAIPYLKDMLKEGTGPKEYLDQARQILASIDK